MANEPPHEGAFNELPPEEQLPDGTPAAPTTAAGKKRRRRTPAQMAAARGVVIETEPDKDEIEEAKFYLETLIYMPAEAFLQFQAPADKLQLRMARLTAKVAIKYLGKHVSDEWKLSGLFLTWSVMQTVNRFFGGGFGQRNNGGVRAETTGQNPLDAPIRTAGN